MKPTSSTLPISSVPTIKILHFVTGGFSGATAVATNLVQHAQTEGLMEPLLVLRRKRQTPKLRLQELREQGIPLATVPGWAHCATIYALVKICRQFKPDILVAHGFSEHIWGRLAGWLAGVPVLIHVEHNSRERYNFWRLWQARWLTRHTRWLIGVSEGVRNCLVERGFTAEKCIFINNGINLTPYQDAACYPYLARTPGIIMIARFARQKDHATLLQALALLKRRGLTPELTLVGGGRTTHKQAMVKLARALTIDQQVQFLGYCSDVPALLKQHQILVLSTHYEGFGLALAEGMAAGCAVVGTEVVGVREWFDENNGGYLVRHQDATHLAQVLEHILTQPQAAAAKASQARDYAVAELGVDTMMAKYSKLLGNMGINKILKDSGGD